MQQAQQSGEHRLQHGAHGGLALGIIAQQPALGKLDVPIAELAPGEIINLLGGQAISEKTVSAVCQAGEFFIPLGELVDLEKEKLEKNKERLVSLDKRIAELG